MNERVFNAIHECATRAGELRKALESLLFGDWSISLIVCAKQLEESIPRGCMPNTSIRVLHAISLFEIVPNEIRAALELSEGPRGWLSPVEIVGNRITAKSGWPESVRANIEAKRDHWLMLLRQGIHDCRDYFQSVNGEPPAPVERAAPPAKTRGKKGGRPSKWDDLLAMSDKMRQETPGVTDEEICRAYNKHYSRRPPANVKSLRNARNTRRNSVTKITD